MVRRGDMERWDTLAVITIGIAMFGMVSVVIPWLNPPLKPPEDEWDKWSKL